jgi:MFS family permease
VSLRPSASDESRDVVCEEVCLLLVAFVALALVLVPVFGGRLSRMADLRFRMPWLLPLAYLLQAAVVSFEGPPAWWRSAIHVSSYLVAAWFLVLNRRIPGLWLIGVGTALNVLAIAANGGVMPAAPHAAAAAGLPPDAGVFSNSAVLEHARLLFLGDVFAIPAGLPFSNVFSAGDVCIALGVAITIHRVTGSRLVPSGQGQFSTVVRRGPFMRLWGAQLVSNLGDWMYWVAVATALSQVGEGYARLTAILIVAEFLPRAIVGAFVAGPVADRFPRRGVMIVADVVRAVAVASLFLGDPSVGHYLAVAVILGVFGGLFQPALMASIPNVVSGGEIVAANAMIGASLNIAIAAGPAIGGFLSGSLGFGPVFAVNAVSFAVSAALIAGVRLPRSAREGVPGSAWRDLVEGAVFVRTTPVVRSIMVVISLVLLGAASRTPIERVFVRDVLAAGGTLGDRALVFGFITTAWGLGMVLGAVAAPALARRWTRERLFALSIALVSLGVLVVSQTGDFSTVLLMWLLAGVANAVGIVSYESLLLERSPDEVRGRVFAFTEAATDVTYLLGALLGGLLGSWFAPDSALAVSGGVLALAAVLAWRLVPAPVRAPLPEPTPAQT